MKVILTTLQSLRNLLITQDSLRKYIVLLLFIISCNYNIKNNDGYVASNSLPSYQITTELPKSILPEAVAGNELPNSGYNPNTLKYSILSFPSPVPFITGDEIFYTAQGTVIPNLPESS